MQADTPLSDDPDLPDVLLGPAWQDGPDETDADLIPRRRTPSAQYDSNRIDGTELSVLLTTLADASDALARLDARVAAANDAVQTGLLTRLALTEAAGWLAHAQAWVHPLDLALREAGLTAPAALAALGAGARALPNTMAQPAGRLAWDDPPLETLSNTEQAIGDALALACLLRRLPSGGPHPFASATATASTFATLGVALDPDRLAAWWNAHTPAQLPRRRFGARPPEAERTPLPPLLAGAAAAAAWMAADIIDPPNPGHALLASFGRSVRRPPARHVFVPLWSAYPAVGFGERDVLPILRSEAADRVAGWSASVAWPVAGLHLIAESARMGLRELERLETAAERGREALIGADRRSRLPDTLDVVLRRPVVTPKALADRLRSAPQTATALLREMQAKGVVKEVTGRGRFRAYAV